MTLRPEAPFHCGKASVFYPRQGLAQIHARMGLDGMPAKWRPHRKTPRLSGYFAGEASAVGVGASSLP